MISSAIHGWIARRLPTAPTAVRNAKNGGPARSCGGRAVFIPRCLNKIRDGSAERNGDVPVALPSSIFDFVPGVRAPAGPPKYVVCFRPGRTPYIYIRSSKAFLVILLLRETPLDLK